LVRLTVDLNAELTRGELLDEAWAASTLESGSSTAHPRRRRFGSSLSRADALLAAVEAVMIAST
jgi:hypothetical protein